MAQVPFQMNQNGWIAIFLGASNGTLSFVPAQIWDSISFNTVNIAFSQASTNSDCSFSISIGLYSLNGSSLSLHNSISRQYTETQSARIGYISLTATSASQNITPGAWWWGINISTSVNSRLSFGGFTSVNPANAFPGGFIGGRVTASTAGLPASYATSDLDITGNDALFEPNIIISA